MLLRLYLIFYVGYVWLDKYSVCVRVDVVTTFGISSGFFSNSKVVLVYKWNGVRMSVFMNLSESSFSLLKYFKRLAAYSR